MSYRALRVVVGDRQSGKTTMICEIHRTLVERSEDADISSLMLVITNSYEHGARIQNTFRSVNKLNSRHNIQVLNWHMIGRSPSLVSSFCNQPIDHLVIDEPNYSGITMQEMLRQIHRLNIGVLTIVGTDQPGMTPMKHALMLLLP